jgi:hypothetical protein
MTAGDDFLDKDGNTDWDALKRALEKIPAEDFQRLAVDLGLIDEAALALVNVAKNSEDPAQRSRARQLIADYGLGLLLIDESDNPMENL